MSSRHSRRFGYVVLLALLVLWPVMVFVRQRWQSVVYQPSPTSPTNRRADYARVKFDIIWPWRQSSS